MQTKKVHRLVCEAFYGPAPEGATDVAHFDGCRTNNRVENLRWASRKENMQDAIQHGTTQRARGSQNSQAKLTEEDVRAIRAAPKRRGILYELAERYGVSRNVVGNIRTKTSRHWSHIRYTHSEDPTGELYVTMTLDELEQIDPDTLKNKCVRIELEPGQELPELDCLSITAKMKSLDDEEDLQIDATDDFNFAELLAQKLEDVAVPVREFIYDELAKVADLT